MITDNHAVKYTGDSKELIEQQHIDNRQILIRRGTVTQEQIDKVS